MANAQKQRLATSMSLRIELLWSAGLVNPILHEAQILPLLQGAILPVLTPRLVNFLGSHQLG